MKQVYSIGRSDELDAAQTLLLIEVGNTHCSFAVVDYANFMMVQSCLYHVEEKDNADILKMVVDRHEELQRAFRQTIIVYYTGENILVPSKFYRHNEAQNLLHLMYEKGQNIVLNEAIPAWQLHNVYYVPNAVHALLSRRFATGNFWHIYSVMLKNGLGHVENGRLFVDFRSDSFSAMVLNNGSLLLAQVFPYTTSADVLYWLLKTCRQFSLLQNEVTLILAGLIDRSSAMFKDIYQYFTNVEFAKLENDVQLSGDFNDYPVHFFSSFYKLLSCAS